MIGPFSGPYFSVQSTKLKAVFVVKMFLDSSRNVLNNVFRKLLLKEQGFSGIVTSLFLKFAGNCKVLLPISKNFTVILVGCFSVLDGYAVRLQAHSYSFSARRSGVRGTSRHAETQTAYKPWICCPRVLISIYRGLQRESHRKGHEKRGTI